MKALPAIAIAVVSVALSVAPLLARGFGMGHDWLLELVRIAEFRHALQEGQWPPFWASNLYAGFGSPIFLFYPPLFVAVASAIAACGADTMDAAVGALCVFTVLGGVLMWRCVRGVLPDCPEAAAAAVVLFSLHPYLLADKWIRNANAEFAALSLLPAVLIGATAIEPRRQFWWSAISIAFVVLAHNFIALVATAVTVALAIFVHRSVRAILPFVSGMIAGLALSAFFWVPAFLLQPLIRTEDLLSGKFDFHSQFPSIFALFWPTEFYSPGWLAPIVVLLALFARLDDSRPKLIARLLATAGLVCIAMTLRLSTPLWEMLPLLRFAQFPWRFIGPLGVFVAAGAAIAMAPALRGQWRGAVLIGVAVVAILNALPAIRQFEPLAPEYTNRVEPALTPDGIRSRDLRTTVHDEYLPRGADLGAVAPVDNLRLFKHWAFPVWTARRNGDVAEPETGSGGVVAVRIEAAGDTVAIALREPPVRRIAKLVSIGVAALLVVLAAVQLRQRRSRGTDAASY